MLTAKLRQYITLEIFQNPPAPQQVAEDLKSIMQACSIEPVLDNLKKDILTAGVAIALELDSAVEKDEFSISLDNELKIILRASSVYFSNELALALPAVRAPVVDLSAPVPIVKTLEPVTTTDSTDSPESGPGPIAFHINNVRAESTADEQDQIPVAADNQTQNFNAWQRKAEEIQAKQTGIVGDTFRLWARKAREQRLESERQKKLAADNHLVAVLNTNIKEAEEKFREFETKLRSLRTSIANHYQDNFHKLSLYGIYSQVYIPEQLEQDINAWLDECKKAFAFVEEVERNDFYGSETLKNQFSSYALSDEGMNKFIEDYYAQLAINKSKMAEYQFKKEQEAQRLREEQQVLEAEQLRQAQLQSHHYHYSRRVNYQ
jgi:hypothetical protein